MRPNLRVIEGGAMPPGERLYRKLIAEKRSERVCGRCSAEKVVTHKTASDRVTRTEEAVWVCPNGCRV